MIQASYLSIATIPLITLAGSVFLAIPARASGVIEVTCQLKTSVPTVIATLSNQNVSQITPILSFLPEYFRLIKH
ncbi:MAG: hypothetical protein HC775_18935 [Hyellaceae cyanobacterium CSU_1_1]|nr:hypothetical protein [Hyellaceae cyanobacterium CSU_1_1]